MNLRRLAWFEVVSGLFCVGGAFVMDARGAGYAHFTAPSINLAVGTLTLLGGLLLLMREKLGVVFSLVIQLAQVVNFNLGVRYVYLAGLGAKWVLASTGTEMDFVAGGAFDFLSTSPNGVLAGRGVAVHVGISIMPGGSLEDATWSVGVNVIAAYCALQLWRALRAPAPVDVGSDQVSV